MVFITKLLLAAGFASAATPGYVKFDAVKKRADSDSYYSDKAYYSVDAVSNGTNGTNLTVSLTNYVEYYMVDLLVGSDEQNVTVQLDTGSSDLWFNSYDSLYCIIAEFGGSEDSIATDYGQITTQSLYTDFLEDMSRLEDIIATEEIEEDEFYTLSDEYITADDYYGSATGFTDDYYASEDYYGTEYYYATEDYSDYSEYTATATDTYYDDEGDYDDDYATYATATFNFEPTATAFLDEEEGDIYFESNCSEFGTFDQDTSDSFIGNDTLFEAFYDDDSYAIGEYGKDTVILGEFEIDNCTFGVAYDSSIAYGILGIGFPNDEDVEFGTYYANLPYLLRDQGYINRTAYSIFLGAEEANSSAITFGAVDTSKFDGNLTIVPIVESPGINYGQEYTNTSTIGITLSSITAIKNTTKGSKTTSKSTVLAKGQGSALLDIGTTLTYAPYYVINAIIGAFPDTFYYSKAYGYYIAERTAVANKSLEFNFQGANVTAPLSSFMLDLVYSNQSVSNFGLLGILDSGSNDYLLGDTFLRNAYFVVDMENYEVAIGQAVIDADEDDEEIEVIPEEGDIPSATSAKDYTKSYGHKDQTGLSLVTTVNPTSFTTTSIIATLQEGNVMATTTNSTTSGNAKTTVKKTSITSTSKSSSATGKSKSSNSKSKSSTTKK